VKQALKNKIKALRQGERIITNDDELDEIGPALGDDGNHLRSIPNPRRVGILDKYEAWIGKTKQTSS
jgi:hypothetical protein